MTVQTLWGYAQMYVYDTGRDLLELGIVPLDNMLPETALHEAVVGARPHRRPRRGPAHDAHGRSTTRSPTREPHNGYLILQGGLPEIEEFVCQHWK